MGFGVIAAQIITFIAIISIASGLAISMKAYNDQTTAAFKIQQNILVDALKTDISIISTSYNSSTNPDTLTVYVKNTGKTKLEMDYTDIYVDGARYDVSSRTITVESDTETGNPLLWDPKEIIKIVVQQDISPGIHQVRVATDNGVVDEDSFSN